MMDSKLVAYCGLVCSECPAYLATIQNDADKLIELAMKWYQKENDPDLVRCNGCTSEGPHLPFCAECGVRLCGRERNVITCAHCEEYGCGTLQAFFKQVPDAEKWLKEIRDLL
jgi:hypothetical protein